MLLDAFLGAVAGTGLVTFAFKLFEIYFGEQIKYTFNLRIAAKNEKDYLANEVLKVVTEGESSGYSIPPNDDKHIYFLLNKLTLISGNDALHDKLVRFVGYWTVNGITQKFTENPTKGMIELAKSTRDDCNALIPDIMEGIKTLKKG